MSNKSLSAEWDLDSGIEAEVYSNIDFSLTAIDLLVDWWNSFAHLELAITYYIDSEENAR